MHEQERGISAPPGVTGAFWAMAAQLKPLAASGKTPAPFRIVRRDRPI